MSRDAKSIRRFTWLLDQRGYSHVGENNLESVIAIRDGKRPDFFVDTQKGVRFLAEVKSFEKPTAVQLNDSSNFVMFTDEYQKRINAQPIEKAARQLAPYRNDGLPLIVVLDNHRQMVGLSPGTVELIQIFGSLQYEFAVEVSSGRTIDEGWAHSPKDRALGGQRRPYLSAVVVNIPEARFDTTDAADDFSIPRPMRVHVIHNPEAAHPLPLWVFSRPKDKQIIRLHDRWIEFQCPPAKIRHEHIAYRAYELYERRGREHGQDVEDWLRAERESRDSVALIAVG